MKRSKALPYILLLPMLAWICFIFIYPVCMTLGLGFFELDLVKPLREAVFVGFDNFSRLFASATFWISVRTTTIYTSISVAGAFLLGLTMALMVNANFRGRIVARALLIIPWTLPPVSFCMIWAWMLDYQFGIVNHVLLDIGIISEPVKWLFSKSTALPVVCIVTTWFIAPLAMLIFLAGLQTIPEELYEAAVVDGAGSLAKFRYVTWPGIKPSRDLLLILLIIWIFRWFVIIFLLTGGGPGRSTETLIVQTYIEGFRYYRLGLASAIATIVMFILAVTIYLYIRLIVRQREGVL
jgi:multiple sugar transport system permease protein